MPAEKSPSSVPPSSDSSGGDGRAAARIIRAINPSELTSSAEDLAAISIRARSLSTPEETPLVDSTQPPVNSEDAWDPMLSYATRESSAPPSEHPPPRVKRPPRTAVLPEDAPPVVATRGARERIGDLVADRYEIKRLLGEGGMASVFEAFDRERAKKVALKVMHADYAGSAELVARFRREARVASAVTSEHIVRILDVGKADGVGLYLVMELLTGEDVAALLGRSGRMPWKTACILVAQAASGLAAAHAAGVVHRDIKPANLFLGKSAEGAVKLTVVDFGVAKPEEEGTPEGLTSIGTVLGTPQYMAPEQARAERPLGPRVDVYSLGAAMFEMIAGRPAFAERETIHETLFDVATKAAPRLASVRKEVPPAVDELVADMMCREPSLRLGDMELVLRRLEGLGAEPAMRVDFSDLTAAVSEDPRKRTTSKTRIKTSDAPDLVRPKKAPRPAKLAAAKSQPLWVPWVVALAIAGIAIVGIFLLR